MSFYFFIGKNNFFQVEIKAATIVNVEKRVLPSVRGFFKISQQLNVIYFLICLPSVSKRGVPKIVYPSREVRLCFFHWSLGN